MRVFSLALVLCAISFAQDTTATVEGRVLDPSGRVITGAVVRATVTSTGYTRSQITSSSGGYHLSLPAATYDILRASVSVRIELRQTQRGRAQLRRGNAVVRKGLTAEVVDQGYGLAGLWIASRTSIAWMAATRCGRPSTRSRSFGF
jgi:hypothetical protein